jgi:phosphate transport system protein
VLSRFGGYGYEIIEVLDMIGSISKCDKIVVTEAANVTSEMISLSVNALYTNNKQISDKLYDMDDIIDRIYRDYLREIIVAKKDSQHIYADPRCIISALYVLRYLERVADHACFIADSVSYIITGKSNPRRAHMNP